eukprot:8202941-Alexandrium_andersonii.AAC.1
MTPTERAEVPGGGDRELRPLLRPNAGAEFSHRNRELASSDRAHARRRVRFNMEPEVRCFEPGNGLLA